MRKLILIIALTMVPLGIWTAGCRNDQQAAFPDTPEMKSLARPSDEKASEVAVAPMIPAKPIDREILHYPDNATLARVQAVRDRANRYASEKVGHGLFTLPEEDNYMASASAAPKPDNAENSEIMIPAPSAREFWSRPVANRGNNGKRSRAGLPEDVSAMAGPARSDDGGMMVPPPPTRPPARSARDELILPPDDLPGVFMVGEADDPPGAPPPARGWFGMLREDGGDARGAPPLSSGRASRAAVPPPRSVERRLLSAAGARPRAEITQRKPMLLDIDRLVGVDAEASAAPTASRSVSVSTPAGRELAERRFAVSAPEAFPPIAPGARIVSSEGMDFEPLPEPVPLAQYNSMVMDELAAGVPAASAPAAKKPETLSAPVLPLPAALLRGNGEAAPVAAPAIPELTEVKTAVKIPGSAQFAKVEQALAPLPVLSAPASSVPTPSPASAPARQRQEKIVVALPAPMPEPLPTPEAAAAKAALLEFSPEAMDEAFAELKQNDFFKTDFWDPAAKTQMKMEKSSLPELPELSDPAAAPVGLTIPLPPPLLEEPRKIVLQPIRKGTSAMTAIDSATDAPPLKF